MIVFDKVEGGIMLNQHLLSPSVYLDHWALREISESDSMARRFSEALKSRQGTWAISLLNVIEFCKVSDKTQRAHADALLDRVSPHLFWLDPDFFTVGKREEKGRDDGYPTSPASDLGFANFFVQTGLSNPSLGQSLGPTWLFKRVHEDPGLPHKYDAFADLVISQLQFYRGKFVADKDLRKAVLGPPWNQLGPRSTRAVAHELMGRLLKDAPIKLNRNNAIDLSHTAVPVSYCDYVMLDAHWVATVEHARSRFAQGGKPVSLARVFSKRRNGLEAFFRELESPARD